MYSIFFIYKEILDERIVFLIMSKILCLFAEWFSPLLPSVPYMTRSVKIALSWKREFPLPWEILFSSFLILKFLMF